MTGKYDTTTPLHQDLKGLWANYGRPMKKPPATDWQPVRPWESSRKFPGVKLRTNMLTAAAVGGIRSPRCLRTLARCLLGRNVSKAPQKLLDRLYRNKLQ